MMPLFVHVSFLIPFCRSLVCWFNTSVEWQVRYARTNVVLFCLEGILQGKEELSGLAVTVKDTQTKPHMTKQASQGRRWVSHVGPCDPLRKLVEIDMPLEKYSRIGLSTTTKPSYWLIMQFSPCCTEKHVEHEAALCSKCTLVRLKFQ